MVLPDFSLFETEKSGANLIIFPEKSAKNFCEISLRLRWPVPEVKPECLPHQPVCFP